MACFRYALWNPSPSNTWQDMFGFCPCCNICVLLHCLFCCVQAQFLSTSGCRSKVWYSGSLSLSQGLHETILHRVVFHQPIRSGTSFKPKPGFLRPNLLLNPPQKKNWKKKTSHPAYLASRGRQPRRETHRAAPEGGRLRGGPQRLHLGEFLLERLVGPYQRFL